MVSESAIGGAFAVFWAWVWKEAITGLCGTRFEAFAILRREDSPGVRGTCNEILLRSNSDRSPGILCFLFLLDMRGHTCTRRVQCQDTSLSLGNMA